jgi:hypothetical protein
VINFSRTWPLIIIVVGLVKLVERLLVQPTYPATPAYQNAPYSPQPPYPPAGGPKV